MPDSDRVETDPCPGTKGLVTTRRTLARCQRFFLPHTHTISAMVAASTVGCFCGILTGAFTAATIFLVIGHLAILALLVAVKL